MNLLALSPALKAAAGLAVGVAFAGAVAYGVTTGNHGADTPKFNAGTLNVTPVLTPFVERTLVPGDIFDPSRISRDTSLVGSVPIVPQATAVPPGPLSFNLYRILGPDNTLVCGYDAVVTILGGKIVSIRLAKTDALSLFPGVEVVDPPPFPYAFETSVYRLADGSYHTGSTNCVPFK
jgi:hypothetical protein